MTKTQSIITDPNQKPNGNTIEDVLSLENWDLYETAKELLSQLGTPDLLWKGHQNGWVLSISQGNGIYGSIILAEDTLVGQIGLNRNQSFGINTDPEFPKDLEVDIPYLFTNSAMPNFIKVPLKDGQNLRDFITLMKLKIRYS